MENWLPTYRLRDGRPENWISIPGGSGDVPLNPLHYTVFEVQQVSCPSGTWGFVPEVKQSKYASDL
jgi:hypothetical protein